MPTGEFQIRPYVAAGFGPVAEFWRRINRDLAPADMSERFEHYAESIIEDELAHMEDRFSAAQGSGFWVVVRGHSIVGCFGIERRDQSRCELRRMYLDSSLRGLGGAAWMLDSAEASARQLGYETMVLSTAEIQHAAVRFYEKRGYKHIHTEIASASSVKTVGGGLRRFHYEKSL